MKKKEIVNFLLKAITAVNFVITFACIIWMAFLINIGTVTRIEALGVFALCFVNLIICYFLLGVCGEKADEKGGENGCT